MSADPHNAAAIICPYGTAAPQSKLHAGGSKASVQLLIAVGPTAKTTVRENEVVVALRPAAENG
jgi:hypothetical protein